MELGYDARLIHLDILSCLSADGMAHFIGDSTMLKGSNPSSENGLALEALLTLDQAELSQYHCVDGSLKRVYQLPVGNLALACFRQKGDQTSIESGKALLVKEKKLLLLLKESGLPTANVYGEPFELNGQYAFVMDWISEANLIDVKDQEAASRKLVASFLNITIPSGEGWVLQKNSIEKKIIEQIRADDFSVANVRIQALKLQQQFVQIITILNEKGYLIADLQLLVNRQGVRIIDPIDVVKMVASPNISNMMEYRSVFDESKQSHPDFVKLLYDGKRLLQQCLTCCEMMASLTSKEECEQKMLALLQAKEAQSPREQEDLPQLFLRRRAGPIKRTLPSPRMVAVPEIKENQDDQKVKGSPEKKSRQAPDSPSKILAFQFRALKSSENVVANSQEASAEIERPTI